MEKAKLVAQLLGSKELTVSEVNRYFTEVVKATLPPIQPKGDDVYLFLLDQDRKSKSCSYSCDSMSLEQIM